MTFRQAFQETLAACNTVPLKKRFCTLELKALRQHLADLKECVTGGWLHGERISVLDIAVCEQQIAYVEQWRKSL